MRRRDLLPILLPLALATGAQAVTIRDDVSDATSQTLAGTLPYASVGKFTGSDNDITSGVLIDSLHVLTAKHITFVPADYTFTFTIGGLDYGTVGYTLSGDDDLAIFQLARPVLNVTPALVYTGSSEIGKTATIVGFGLGGNGTDGTAAGNGLRGTKRAATNVIAAYTARQFGFDFDSGLAGDDGDGIVTQTADEGTFALGDSGGGTFATIGGQSYLIGIHSFALVDGDGKDYNYGDVGIDVRVSTASSFIQSVVPEPSSASLVSGGLVGWLVGRRRRRS